MTADELGAPAPAALAKFIPSLLCSASRDPHIDSRVTLVKLSLNSEYSKVAAVPGDVADPLPPDDDPGVDARGGGGGDGSTLGGTLLTVRTDVGGVGVTDRAAGEGEDGGLIGLDEVGGVTA